MKPCVKETSGFTLIELMVVVGILAVLAGFAIPAFQKFRAKARQSEATVNLGHIYTLQAAYHLGNEVYFGGDGTPLSNSSVKTRTSCHNENDLGFAPVDCQKIRYTYTTRGTPVRFLAAASEIGNRIFRRTSVRRQCPAVDLWTMTQDRVLKDVNRAINLCT